MIARLLGYVRTRDVPHLRELETAQREVQDLTEDLANADRLVMSLRDSVYALSLELNSYRQIATARATELRAIASQETPKANGTVRRMARMARVAA